MTYTARLTSGWAALRPITGAEESRVTAADTLNALALLDQLLIDVPETHARPGEAAALTVPDRDRLLAAIYRDTYGPRVVSSPTCRTCGERYDLSFSLDDLLTTLTPDPEAASRQDDGTYALPDGTRFRLPTGADELSVLDLPLEEAGAALLARCVVAGAASPADVESAMEAVGPTVSAELGATCPECGAAQVVYFDMQSYLLSALRGEAQQLAAEVHRLARAYGWSLTELLGLTRAQRRNYLALVEAETSARQSLRKRGA